MGREVHSRPSTFYTCGTYTMQYLITTRLQTSMCLSLIADAPHAVIATPVMLSGVNSSPKNQAEIVIVVTSLAMPAIDIGTTPARWIILARNIFRLAQAQLRLYMMDDQSRQLAGKRTRIRSIPCKRPEYQERPKRNRFAASVTRRQRNDCRRFSTTHLR